MKMAPLSIALTIINGIGWGLVAIPIIFCIAGIIFLFAEDGLDRNLNTFFAYLFMINFFALEIGLSQYDYRIDKPIF